MGACVDQLRTYPEAAIKRAARRYGRSFCHLFADSDEELHAFAAQLGLKRQWAQSMDHPYQRFHHYDLTPAKRALAVRLGAVEVDARERAMETSRWIDGVTTRE